MITLAEAIVLSSIVKPLLMVAALVGWGRWASMLDKDAEYFYLPRTPMNAMTVGAGALAFGLWLLIPIFWLGLPIAAIIIVGAGFGYAQMRNRTVPEAERWSLNADFFHQFIARKRQEATDRTLQLRFVSNDNKSQPPKQNVPLQEDPHYPAHAALDELLSDAIHRHAQRMDLEAGREETKVQLQIDGVSFKGEPMEPAGAVAAIDYLKAQAGLDAEDRRRKQIGNLKINLGAFGEHTLRITTAGSTRGLVCSIEIDPRKQLNIPFDKLGLLESQAAQLKPVLAESEGLVIVATPAKQGRTTTLYALLSQHDPYLTDIHSMEPRVEFELEGVSQHATPGEEWAKPLNSLLLREPAIVMLAQLPDKQTAALAAQAATDGKRVYVGMRADDTFAALRAYARALGDTQTAASGLRAVISQRLVRTLCPACRQPYQPDAAALKKLNVPASRVSQLYKASGQIVEGNKQETCPTCLGIGYIGRSAAYEVMVLDDQARALLAEGDTNGLRSHLRKQKMLWLQEAALAKVVNGQTSISEVMRVLGSGKPQAKGGQAQGGQGGQAGGASS